MLIKRIDVGKITIHATNLDYAQVDGPKASDLLKKKYVMVVHAP